MKWLEVALRVPGELVEPVADLLSRHVHGGVAVETEPGEAGQDLTAEVRGYLPCDDSLETRRRRLEEGLWHLSQIRPLPRPRYRYLKEEAWAEAWKRHYRPTPVGRRLLIHPSWASTDAGDRVPILIDPGMAFGTGTHPTTRLCLEALERHLPPGAQVVDLGCGSGILAIAAARLGAGGVYACDIDPVAVKVARENAERNGVAGIVTVEEGSLAEVLRRPRADLLMANILAGVLQEMLEQGLADALRPGGKAVLSGVLADQAADLLAACRRRGLRHVETLGLEDWRALVVEKRNRPHAGGGDQA